MNRGAFLESEIVKIEHVFTFKLDDKWEKPVRKAVDSVLHISWHWAQSFQVIGYGIAGYLLLLGTARLMEATGKRPPAHGGSGGSRKDSGSGSGSGSSSSSSSRSKSSRSKSSRSSKDAGQSSSSSPTASSAKEKPESSSDEV